MNDRTRSLVACALVFCALCNCLCFADIDYEQKKDVGGVGDESKPDPSIPSEDSVGERVDDLLNSVSLSQNFGFGWTPELDLDVMHTVTFGQPLNQVCYVVGSNALRTGYLLPSGWDTIHWLVQGTCDSSKEVDASSIVGGDISVEGFYTVSVTSANPQVVLYVPTGSQLSETSVCGGSEALKVFDGHHVFLGDSETTLPFTVGQDTVVSLKNKVNCSGVVNSEVFVLSGSKISEGAPELQTYLGSSQYVIADLETLDAVTGDRIIDKDVRIQIVQSKTDSSVNAEFETSMESLNPAELSEMVHAVSNVDPSRFLIVLVRNNLDEITGFKVEVDDPELAKVIADALNNMNEEDCQYGDICKVKRAFIPGEDQVNSIIDAGISIKSLLYTSVLSSLIIGLLIMTMERH